MYVQIERITLCNILVLVLFAKEFCTAHGDNTVVIHLDYILFNKAYRIMRPNYETLGKHIYDLL